MRARGGAQFADALEGEGRGSVELVELVEDGGSHVGGLLGGHEVDEGIGGVGDLLGCLSWGKGCEAQATHGEGLRGKGRWRRLWFAFVEKEGDVLFNFVLYRISEGFPRERFGERVCARDLGE